MNNILITPTYKHAVVKRITNQLSAKTSLINFENAMLRYRTWCLQADQPLYNWFKLSPELVSFLSPELSLLMKVAGSKYRNNIIVEIRRAYAQNETGYKKSCDGVIHIIKHKNNVYLNPKYSINDNQQLITEIWLKYHQSNHYIKSIRTTYKTNIDDITMYKTTNELKLDKSKIENQHQIFQRLLHNEYSINDSYTSMHHSNHSTHNPKPEHIIVHSKPSTPTHERKHVSFVNVPLINNN